MKQWLSILFIGVSAELGLTGQEWTPVTNGVLSGLASALAVGQGETLLAGYSGRVYLSSDRGDSWAHKTNTLGVPVLSVVALHMQSDLIVASTLEKETLPPLFYSADRGATWSKSTVSGLSERATRIITFASLPGVLLAGDQSYGVFRSSNGGADWTPSNPGLPTQFDRYVVADLLAAQGKFFAGVSGGGIYVSEDRGLSWAPAGQLLDENGAPAFGFLGKSLAEGADLALYAMLENAYIYRSQDGGRIWRRISHTLSKNPLNFLHIATSGTLLFALAQDFFTPGNPLRLFRTENGGAQWTEVPLTGLVRPLLAFMEAAHGHLYLPGASALYRLAVGSGPPSAPQLSFAIEAGKLVLCWPSGGASTVLERTASISPGARWEPVPRTPSVSEGRICSQQPMSEGLQFFRLHQE